MRRVGVERRRDARREHDREHGADGREDGVVAGRREPGPRAARLRCVVCRRLRGRRGASASSASRRVRRGGAAASSADEAEAVDALASRLSALRAISSLDDRRADRHAGGEEELRRCGLLRGRGPRLSALFTDDVSGWAPH